MIDIEEISEFKCSISELKKTSYDDSNEQYMTESNLSVYNFDNVMKHYCKSRKIKKYIPSSADAFYVCKNNEMYLIEFKNGRINKEDIFGIKKKILESLLVMTDLFKIHISDTREDLNFILVYNNVKNTSYEEMVQSLDDIAKNDNSMYSLKLFEKIYFKEVFTLNQEEFENDFVKKWKPCNIQIT